jgi:hypothetical protein
MILKLLHILVLQFRMSFLILVYRNKMFISEARYQHESADVGCFGSTTSSSVSQKMFLILRNPAFLCCVNSMFSLATLLARMNIFLFYYNLLRLIFILSFRVRLCLSRIFCVFFTTSFHVLLPLPC